VIEARVTSKGDAGLVRTENKVSNQNGEVVLVYTPQRLVSRAPKT
jgi:acyl dehydratase